jgi:hypothetical protein
MDYPNHGGEQEWCVFTLTGPFSAETILEYDGGDCYIHTSCWVPLAAGNQIGTFKVLAGNNCPSDSPKQTEVPCGDHPHL